MRFMENVGDGNVKIDNGQVINHIYDEGPYSEAEQQFMDKNNNAENWLENFRTHNQADGNVYYSVFDSPFLYITCFY